MNGIQEVDGSIPFGSTFPFRRLRVEVVILLVVLTLAIPGWIAILVRPPLRNATIMDSADMQQRPSPDERVNLALLKWGTWYTASSVMTLNSADVAYVADGMYDKPYPRWTSQNDPTPTIGMHFARPSVIEEVRAVTSTVVERRQVPVHAMRVRCDEGEWISLTHLDARRFGAKLPKLVCNALTFSFGALDEPRTTIGVSELMALGTQPEHTDLKPVPRPGSQQPAFMPEGGVP